MAENMNQAPPLKNLHYKKGDLIIKEGDYGISIYKVLSGEVNIIKETSVKEVVLATLGPGEVFGEMAFLNRASEVRTASARAISDVDLEVWHPVLFTKEYNAMPPMMKYVTKQLIERLIRLNTALGELSVKGLTAPQEQPEDQSSKRRYFRKQLNRPGYYRPKGAPKELEIPTKVLDISMLGLSMDISSMNAKRCKEGDQFHIFTSLPNGQEIEAEAKLVSIKPGGKEGRAVLGLEFTELTGDSAKRLGFFMMAA